MKKKLCLILGLISGISMSFAKPKATFDKKNAVKDEGSVVINDVAAVDAVMDMKTGWNLGNTLDATAGRGLVTETAWGMPKTTKAMIDKLAESGMKTIRMPVTWVNHVDNKNTIDPVWMARVKEVVDWAIEDGMYVIINDHHDNFALASGLMAGKGYYPNKANYDMSASYVHNIWSQIAMAFNNGYDEHLVFETLNEPRLRGHENEWTYNDNLPDCVEAQQMINKLNQVALDAIRASGGNNTKRLIMVPGYCATPTSVLGANFQLPKDSAKNKLIVSVHMYTPFIFAGQSPGAANFTPKMQQEFASTFKRLNQKFVQNGVGVVIGEYGAVNKNNTDQRVAWFHSFIKYSRLQGITACLWDNGKWKITGNDYSERFGYFNRRELEWYFPEILEAIMEEAGN